MRARILPASSRGLASGPRLATRRSAPFLSCAPPGLALTPRVALAHAAFTRPASSSAAPSDAACWSCRAATRDSTRFCDACGKVQPIPRESSHFTLLKISPVYEIDYKVMHQNYRDTLMNLHPDKFNNASPEEKELSASGSSRVNEAYKVLKSPVRRAAYMLKTRGINALNDDDMAKSDSAPHQPIDPEVLMEAMELRERVEETKDRKALERLRGEVESQLKSCGKEFTRAFDALETEVGKKLAIKVTTRMRYLEKVLQELDERDGE